MRWKAVSRILDYLNQNFHEAITLDMLAAEVGLSTFRIAHLMKEQTGKTVLQHVHHLRVQEAQRLLEQSDMSCTDIAYETGFGDQSYFIKQFRKWMGITPARYRRLYRSRRQDDRITNFDIRAPANGRKKHIKPGELEG